MVGAPAQRHGQIACGTISVANLDRSVSLYERVLRYLPVETGEVSVELATSWGTPDAVGARYAISRPDGGGPGALRFIESGASPEHVPAASFGWNAFELTVNDVFELATHIEKSEFRLDGPPKLVDGFTSFIPMQVFGPDGEVLFLNQVNHSDDDADLPKTNLVAGEIFIAVLAARDRECSASEYTRGLVLDRAATHTLRYGLVNRAFGLPEQTTHTITMIQNGRTPFAQIDQYPVGAKTRVQQPGQMPAGNAMVSVYVKSLTNLPWSELAISEPSNFSGEMYNGGAAQVVRGASGELLELIELQAVMSEEKVGYEKTKTH